MENIKLKINNFRSIESIELDLNGIVLISGQNGFGKSSIMKAYNLCLYDYSKESLSDLINWNNELGYFELNLTFIHESKNFDIDYYYDKKGSKRLLKIDNEVPLENTNAVKKLNEIFNPKLEIPASCIAQKEEGIVDIKPSERRDYLKKIYNLDYSKNIKVIQSDIDKIEKNDIKEVDNKILLLENKNYQEKPIIDNPYTDEDIQEFNDQIQSLSDKIDLIKEEKIKYDSLVLRRSQINKEVSDYSNKNKSITDSIIRNNSEIGSFQEYYKQINNDPIEILIKEKELKVIEKSKISLEEIPLFEDSSIDILIKEKELKVIEKSKISLGRVPLFDEKLLDNALKNQSEIKSQILKEESTIKQIKDGKCPVCGTVFTSDDIQSHQTDRDNWVYLLNESNGDIEKLKKEKQNNQDLKDGLSQKKNDIKLIDEKILSLEKQIIAKQQEIENKKISYQNQKKNDIKLLEEKIISLEKQIISKQQEIESKKSNYLSQISIKQGVVKDLEESLNENNIKIQSLSLEVSNIKISEVPEDPSKYISEKTLLENNIKKQESHIIIMQENIKHNDNLKLEKIKDKDILFSLYDLKSRLFEKRNMFDESKEILSKKFPNYVLGKILGIVESNINRIVTDIYHDMDIKIAEQKDSIHILYGPKQKDLFLSSGFERDLLNISWKLSLQSFVSSGLFFMDEADSAADTENSIKVLRTMIDAKNKGLIKNLVIITHKDFLKEILVEENAMIYEIKDGKII